MVQGTLEVLLIGAKGLENTDFLRNMDPYAILTYRSQEQRSSIATAEGSDPEWNENFIFTVSDSVSELNIKLMDSDSGTNDDFVGEVKIPLDALFCEGSIPPAAYNVIKEEEYRGEIKVGLSFTPERLKGKKQGKEFENKEIHPLWNLTGIGIKQRGLFTKHSVMRSDPRENTQQDYEEAKYGGWKESS